MHLRVATAFLKYRRHRLGRSELIRNTYAKAWYYVDYLERAFGVVSPRSGTKMSPFKKNSHLCGRRGEAGVPVGRYHRIGSLSIANGAASARSLKSRGYAKSARDTRLP